jgi:hypothetical protein
METFKKLLEACGIEFPDPDFTDELQQDDTKTRQQIAELIAKKPQAYKICCGCDAIVRERVTLCPQCLHYRFEDDPRTVVAHALYLAKREPDDRWVDEE